MIKVQQLMIDLGSHGSWTRVSPSDDKPNLLGASLSGLLR
jgi:hypothetical protein